MPPGSADRYAGYIFLVMFLAFVIGMLVNSLLLEREARRAAEKFEAERSSAYFASMPTMPQHTGVTDHDYWVKRNRSGG